MIDERARTIKQASWVGIIGNGILALLKVSIGLYTGSLSVIGDGIDSTSDIAMSIISLFTAIIISKPPDPEHPYGHFRAEAIATSIMSFVMFIVGFELLRSSVSGLIHPVTKGVPPTLTLYVIGISILGKIVLSIYLRKVGNRIDSGILIANSKNMQNDVLISTGVLGGLVFIVFLRIPVIDNIIALLISCWIMFTAVRIFLEINTELMDGVKDQSVYNCIFEALKTTRGAINPHRTRVRKVSSLYMIDLDIEVNGSISVTEAHEIAMEVEHTIKQQLPNVYDIMVHVEPRGNIEEKEKYGISHSDMD